MSCAGATAQLDVLYAASAPQLAVPFVAVCLIRSAPLSGCPRVLHGHSRAYSSSAYTLCVCRG
eukprot:2310697-Prymnesium_polylepis.1